DVDQRQRDRWIFFEDSEPFGPALGMQHLRAVGFEDAGKRVDVANIVVDDEHLGSSERGVALHTRWRFFPVFALAGSLDALADRAKQLAQLVAAYGFLDHPSRSERKR